MGKPLYGFYQLGAAERDLFLDPQDYIGDPNYVTEISNAISSLTDMGKDEALNTLDSSLRSLDIAGVSYPCEVLEIRKMLKNNNSIN